MSMFVLGDIGGLSVYICWVCVSVNCVCGCDLVKIFRVWTLIHWQCA